MVGESGENWVKIRITLHESFLVRPQYFVVSFVLRVPGLEEGVMFSGKALG